MQEREILSRRTPCLERSKSDGAEARCMPVDYPAVPNKSGGAEARCPVQHSISGHKWLEKKSELWLVLQNATEQRHGTVSYFA